ncbi:type II secretion system protein [Candidatus Sumerlaeota bacterium]|nr:type II secretion system protein [Candidatus Sumerlaeota bacterium]
MKKQRAFVLLEILVSIVIIAVALVAIMKGFVLSLDSLKRIRMNEKAFVLARSLMDDLILEPPAEGSFEGNFADDPRFGEIYAGWSWSLEVEPEEPDYDERPRGRLTQDLEEVYNAELKIKYQGENESRTYLNISTILIDADVFSQAAIQANQLF